MANPLSILGNLAGGLATVGAGGARGAYEGQVEGEVLNRKFQSEDMQNNLRALEAILRGQQIRQGQLPSTELHNGYLYRKNPLDGSMMPVRPAPESPGQIATRESHEASTDYHRAQAKNVGVPTDPTHLWMKELGDAITAKDQTRIDRSLGVLNQYEKIRASGAAPVRHFSTHRDAQGNVTGVVSSQKADGTWNVDKIPFGPIGAPPASTHAAIPRVTTTESTRYIPRKKITNRDEINRLQGAMDQTIVELSRVKGFNVPGPTMISPSGMHVRKEDVIAKYWKQKFDTDVKVAWDGKRFKIVEAWEPERKEPMETTRRTGPPAVYAPPAESTEEQ